jgi:hypothetical protein
VRLSAFVFCKKVGGRQSAPLSKSLFFLLERRRKAAFFVSVCRMPLSAYAHRPKWQNTLFFEARILSYARLGKQKTLTGAALTKRRKKSAT